MQLRPFGHTGRELPAVGLGTWQMEGDDPKQVERALDAALEAGMRHIDTAEMYGNGQVEELLGRLLRGRREQVFLTSKVLPQHATFAGTIEACERSLRRLGTDHLELYLLHWPGPHPLEETLRAFSDLQTRGAIEHYGLSNFDTHELEHAIALSGPGNIACNQVLYHLRERAIEHSLLACCRANGVALVAYSPFGSGAFPESGEPGRQVLEEVARECAGTPRQVALAWLLWHPEVFVIPKSASAIRCRENAGATDLSLSEEQGRRISAAFPRGPQGAGLPMI